MNANLTEHQAKSASSAHRGAPIKILVADDHPVVREGLANILRQQEDLLVVAETHDGAETLAAWERLRPTVTMLDLRMPVLDGLAVITRIRQMDLRARIIVLTTHDNEDDVFHAMRAGARAYLLKDSPRLALLDCVRKVAAGEIVLSAELAQKLASRVASPELTPREREVLELASLGKANKEIAATLQIGDGTVKAHLKSIFEKLDVLSRTEAVHVARRRGLLSM